VPDFFHGRRGVPHGAVILSDDALSARVWISETARPKAISEIRVVGAPLQRIRGIR
jgi:hypothetical protein